MTLKAWPTSTSGTVHYLINGLGGLGSLGGPNFADDTRRERVLIMALDGIIAPKDARQTGNFAAEQLMAEGPASRSYSAGSGPTDAPTSVLTCGVA
jgi:hypothetical protein